MVGQRNYYAIACRKLSLKSALLLALIFCATHPAHAQTPLRKAPADTSNPCVVAELFRVP
jgi:hypothetical protein